MGFEHAAIVVRMWAAGAAQVHAALSHHVLALLKTSDDDGVIQSCCEYWR